MIDGRLTPKKEIWQHNTVTLYPRLAGNYTACHRRFNGLATMKTRQERTVRPAFPFCSSSGLFRLFIVLFLAECTISCGPGTSRPGPRNPRVPMRLHQKFPDQQETSISASGGSSGRVRRGSPEFKALLGNYNPDIIFKGDKDQDDRRMTKRCSEKLKILADKVKQKWPKVQLRVIAAYSDGRKAKHEKYLLHYEGRAVDITTSDKDRKKYGMLGRLAYEAGFDWVHYGSKNHIHASVKTDIKGAQEGMGCFSGSSSVLLENGQKVKMEKLRVGDKVQSVDKQGNIVFSPVMLFMDYRPKFSVDFMLIETEKPNRKLAITGTHLIYQLNKQTRRESVVFARDTHAGDFVYISNGTNSKNFTAGRVSRVLHKTIMGVYAPLTEQGNIVVDGILCSCYAIVDHNLAHWSFAPVRFAANNLPKLLKWFENGSEGIHWYAQLLQQIYPIWEYVESFQTR